MVLPYYRFQDAEEEERELEAADSKALDIDLVALASKPGILLYLTLMREVHVYCYTPVLAYLTPTHPHARAPTHNTRSASRV